MGTFTFLVFFVAGVLLSFNPVTAASIEEVCKAVTGFSPDVNEIFCVGSLMADPRSGGADTRELAVIATSLALANATSTKAIIEEMLKKPDNPSISNWLKICLSSYSDLIPALQSSISDIKSGKVLDAKTKLDAVRDSPTDCEDYFFEGGITCPVAKEDSDASALTKIALAIATISS